MKIYRGGINQDQAPRSKKGAVQINVRDGSIVVTKWPRQRPATGTGGDLYRQQLLTWAGVWASNPSALDLESAMNLSSGTQYVWRDILTMAMFAALFDILDYEGIHFERWWDMVSNPQDVLDLVGDTLGAMLRRDPVGWVLLLPGDEGDVLGMHEGYPGWVAQEIAPLAEFVVTQPYTGLPNARLLDDSTSILLDKTVAGYAVSKRAALTGDVTAPLNSNVLTIAAAAVTYAKMQNISATARLLGRVSAGAGVTQELSLSTVLDFIGSAAQGDILFRGTSAWQRLPAGDAYKVLTTRGAGHDPDWAAASGALGISGMGASPGGCYLRDTNVYLTPLSTNGNALTTLATSANTLHQVPICVPYTRTFTSIAINVSSLHTAKTARLGIYDNAIDSNGGPGLLNIDCGTVSVGSNGIRTVSFSKELKPGIYWLAYVGDGAPTLRALAPGFGTTGVGFNMVAATPVPLVSLGRSFTYAALPSDETSSTYSLNNGGGASVATPLIGIR